MNKLKVVVVGNGMVGHHYVETLANSEVDAHITVIGGESRPAYDRVHLSEVFDGKEPSDLAMTTREHYDELGVDAHFGDFVESINREAKTVTTVGGQEFSYDKLVLATGSYPFIPPVPGHEQPHCLAYRTIDDLAEIKASAKGKKVGVVVGGGLLGLECANALKNDHRLKMEFADDTELETDMIVFSAGIRPYDQLARDADLKVGERGGIEIDYQCKTSDENIFAIGECAVLGNFIYGLVAPGYRMAEAAVSQLSEEKVSFTGADMSTKLKLLGVDVGSIGDSKGNAEDSRAFVFSDERDEVYKRLNVSAENDIDLPENPENLILPVVDGEAPSLGVDALPMTASICSCHNVSKGDVIEAIDGGCQTVADVKGCTAAATGCGGCAALLKNVVDFELSSRLRLDQ